MLAVQSSPPYAPLTLSIVPDRDEVAVVAVGELDMASVDELDHAVRELKASGFDSIVIDLRGLDFIDVAALRVLLVLSNEAKRDGHALTLLPAGPIASRIFDLTRTRGLFNWREHGFSR